LTTITRVDGQKQKNRNLCIYAIYEHAFLFFLLAQSRDLDTDIKT
jgi:hypothetical protein